MDVYKLDELRKMNQLDGSKELVFIKQLIKYFKENPVIFAWDNPNAIDKIKKLHDLNV